MLSLVKPVRIGVLRRLLCLAVMGGLVISCADLDRSNPLDPKNPNSQSTKVVLVEAFVSQGTGEPYNDYALEALDKLMRTYNTNVIVLEYHVQAVAGEDPLATDANLAKYRNYELESDKRASPDVFFSGNVSRVQGASSANVAYSRYEDALLTALNAVSHLTIEAKAKLSGAILSVDVEVARLGSSKASNVTLFMAIIEDLDAAKQHRVVREFLPIETLGTLEAGEIVNAERQIQLSPQLANSNFQVVVFAQNTGSGGVYQAAWAER